MLVAYSYSKSFLVGLIGSGNNMEVSNESFVSGNKVSVTTKNKKTKKKPVNKNENLHLVF